MRPLHQTLRRPVRMSGTGLHSGASVTVRLRPRQQPGIVFARVDLPGHPEVPAALRCVARTEHATTLEWQGASAGTTEHLLAALWAGDITACRVELDGPEVPILDGSAAPWCQLLQEAGAVALTDASGGEQRPLYTLREPVWVVEGDAAVLGLPHHELRLTAAVDYGLDYLGRQTVDLVVTAASFARELAPARTFTLERWIEPLLRRGLIRGGAPDNAIVLRPDGPSLPWRFTDEVARHKALDVVGDIALLFGEDGGCLQAHLIAVRAGHRVHQRWMDECVRRGALVAHPVAAS